MKPKNKPSSDNEGSDDGDENEAFTRSKTYIKKKKDPKKSPFFGK